MKKATNFSTRFNGIGVLSRKGSKWVLAATDTKDEKNQKLIDITDDQLDELRASKVIKKSAKLVDGAQYWVSTYNDEVQQIRPASGKFVLKFAGFKRTEDDDYFLYKDTRKFDGGEESKAVSFVAQWVGVGTRKGSADCTGFIYADYMPLINTVGKPSFVADEDGFATWVPGKGGIIPPKVAKFISMLEAMGMEDVMLTYNKDLQQFIANIEQAIDDEGKNELKVVAKIVNGYIESYDEFEGGMEQEAAPAPEYPNGIPTSKEEKKPAPAKASRFDEEE